MTMTMNPSVAAATAASPSAGTAPGLNPGNAAAGKAARVGSADRAASDAVVGLPFAPLMAPVSDRDASMPQTTDAREGGADECVDALDAALMQALDEVLGRGAAASGNGAIGVVAGGVRPEGADLDATTSQDGDALPAAASAPLMALLMPTLMPTLMPAVMPPAPLAREASDASGSATLPTSGAAAPQTATAVPSALTTDAVRLLALQGADAALAPTNSADAGTWQGLQRWSADLMTTMTPGAMSGANVATSMPSTPSTPSTLTLPASREAWQQPLMQALGDRLQLQIAQRADSARLHLEPPQLGRIEIDIRQQGGALQVQLSASNDDVRQQLRQIAEPLRHELVQRHAGDVSVQVASGAQAAGDGRGRDGAASGGQPQSNGQPRDAQRQPGRALQDDDQGTSGAPGAFGFADALAGNAGSATGGGGVVGVMSGNTRTTR